MVTPSPHFLFLPIVGEYIMADSLVIIRSVQISVQSGEVPDAHP